MEATLRWPFTASRSASWEASRTKLGFPISCRGVVDLALAAVRVVLFNDLYPWGENWNIARELRSGKLGPIGGFRPIVATGDKLVLANGGSKQFDDRILVLQRQLF